MQRKVYEIYHIIGFPDPYRWMTPYLADDPVEVFESREEAEQYVRDKRTERYPFPNINPFDAFSRAWNTRHYHALSALTSFPEPVFHDWLLEVDIPTPTDFSDDEMPIETWIRWFEETSPNLTKKQITRIWQGLDKVEMFRVVPADTKE